MKQKECLGVMSAFLILGIFSIIGNWNGFYKTKCLLSDCKIGLAFKDLCIWLIMGFVLIGVISLFNEFKRNKEIDKENIDKSNDLKQSSSSEIRQIIKNKKSLSLEKLQQIEEEKKVYEIPSELDTTNIWDHFKKKSEIENELKIKKSIKRHNKK